MEKEKNTNDKNFENQTSDKIPPETKSKNEQIEKDLNAKILKITMRIKDHYPELSKYLEEMPMTIQSENDPEITLKQLKTYYESLNSLLKKYKVDFPRTEE